MIRFALLFFLISFPTLAGTYDLKGTFQQGGLVFGTVTPGSHVYLDAKELPVSVEGLFLLGFGRSHPSESHLQITYPDGQQVNQTLTITKQDYNIQRINGLPKKKVTPDPELVKRIRSDNAGVAKTRKITSSTAWFKSGFQKPVEGPITGVFGSQRILNGKARSPHKGVDIAAPIGTPLLADADGVISFVHHAMYLMGKGVMIDHGHGLHTIYIHMDEITVNEGDFVKKGQMVGRVGKTGRATGAHVHWGISLNSIALDPLLVLN